MGSLFPGMDPYLERATIWPQVQHHLVAALYQLLLPGLVDKYRARVGLREYVAETPLFTSVVRETHTEEFLEIRSRENGRLVTRVDVVSIANRTTAAGRAEYQAARQEAAARRVGLVEISLVTQGEPPGVPPGVGADYAVSVIRATAPDRIEVHAGAVERRLPKFKLPLAADDRDTVVDLQVVYARAASQGDFHTLVDYAAGLPPEVVLTAGRDWASRVAAGNE